MTEHAENDAQFTFQERLHIAMALAEGGWNRLDAEQLTAFTSEQRERERRLGALSLYCGLPTLRERVGSDALRKHLETPLSRGGRAWISELSRAVSTFSSLCGCPDDVAECGVATILEIGVLVESLSFGEKRGGDVAESDLSSIRDITECASALQSKLKALSPAARVLLAGYFDEDYLLFSHFFSNAPYKGPVAAPLAEVLDHVEASRTYGAPSIDRQVQWASRELGALLLVEKVRSYDGDELEFLASDTLGAEPSRMFILGDQVNAVLTQRLAILSDEHFGHFRLVESALHCLVGGTELATSFLEACVEERRAALEGILIEFAPEGEALDFVSAAHEHQNLRSRFAAPAVRAAFLVVAADAILLDCANEYGAATPSAEDRDGFCNALRLSVVGETISQPVKSARRQLKKFGFDFAAVSRSSVWNLKKKLNRTLTTPKAGR